MKVIIVENSSIIVKRLHSILSDIEFIDSVGHANDGEEALMLNHILEPDVILLDIRIPKLDGIEVLRRVKSENKNTKVIVLTNYPEPRYRKSCSDLGAEFFFDKSSEFDLLEDAIRSLEAA